MLARLPLRSKLILVVSIPLLLILGLAATGIDARLGDLEAQRQYGRLRAPNAALGATAEALETEGVLTTWYVAAKGDPAVRTRLNLARGVTDRAVAAVTVADRGLAAGDVSSSTGRAWASLEDRLDTLDTLRRQADELAGLPAAFADRYEGLTDSTIDVSAQLARDVTDRRLSDSMLGVVNLRREQASAADDAMIVMPYLVNGSPTQFNDWITTLAEQDDAAEAFLAIASPGEQAAFTRTRDDLSVNPVREAAGPAPTGFPDVSLTPGQYYATWRPRQLAYSWSIDAVQRVVDNMAAAHEADALRSLLGYTLGISLLVLLVVVLAWRIVRSVNRSLRSVTDAARDVAENQLPHLVDTLQRGGETAQVTPITPLKVESKDEIGALVEAFNTIQETTVRVAEEQSALLRKGIGDLYVNLARRNQALLDRQIALLDALEARAEDPDQLSSLFDLDHLATRMRRNAESLLVLSGAGQARQWTEAIPILDVARAASAEIADFARVTFVGLDGDIAVAGNAVADVTHILAELLENATSFSPPGSVVVVAGMLAERRFVVSITDEGIGMDDQQLAAANALLQQPPPAGLALSRTLGLYVVAHLASRYGVRVQLRRSATNGVTAIVALPSTVLTRVDAVQPGSQPAPVPTQAVAPPLPTDPPLAPHPAAPPLPSRPTPSPSYAPPAPASAPAAPPPPPVPHEVVQPEVVVQPELVVQAEVVQPEVVQPEVVPPEVVPPEVVQPEVVQPEVVQPEVIRPEVFASAPHASAWDPIGTSPAPAPAGAPVHTIEEPVAVWADPEIIPPAFDPAMAVPPAATPPDPMPHASDPSDPAFDPGAGLPRRMPGSSPLGDEPGRDALPKRDPGNHLSHRPGPGPSTPGAHEVRPRPERVHDLLTRHLRGIRDGREEHPAGVTRDRLDAEDRP